MLKKKRDYFRRKVVRVRNKAHVPRALCTFPVGKTEDQARTLHARVLLEGPAQLQGGRGGHAGPLRLDGRAGEWWCGESSARMKDGEKSL